MNHLTEAEAGAFAAQWLPAWSGNKPELLAAFYAEDAVYIDPGIPQGVRGKAALLSYFRKLLANNPDWVWTQIEAIPLQDGFLNKWLARIPVGSNVVEVVGVCLASLVLIVLGGGWLSRHYYDEIRRYQLSAELLKAYDAADVTLCNGKLCANVDPKAAKSGDKGQYRPVRDRP